LKLPAIENPMSGMNIVHPEGSLAIFFLKNQVVFGGSPYKIA
jgi:hypothetical protein